MKKQHVKIIDKILKEVKDILVYKSNNYSYNWVKTGMRGLFWDITRKYLRIEAIIGDCAKRFRKDYTNRDYLEKLYEETIDLMGYSMLTCLYLRILMENKQNSLPDFDSEKA